MTAPAARPNTAIGRALAERVVPHLAWQAAPSVGLIDLTRAEVAATPTVIREAAKAALDEGETHYTAGSGIPELRTALAAQLTAEGFSVDAAGLGITNGGTEAIYIALQSALRPGDRALYVEPMSPHIVQMLRFVGAEPAPIVTRPDDGFLPRLSALDVVDARLLLITSPSPITGKLIPNEHLSALLAAARERDMAVILDRSYAPGVYRPQAAFPDAALACQIVTVGSFSAVHGLTGWRVGYYSAPPAEVGAFNNLKQSMSICTTAVSQFAARAALVDAPQWLAERKLRFAAARDAAVARLSAAGVTVVVPDALPPLLIDARTFGDDIALTERLAGEFGVWVEHGTRFGASTAGFLRINLGAPPEVLDAGLARLCDALPGFLRTDDHA